jgi:anaerobic selenocysteine-containing dehydrogenase
VHLSEKAVDPPGEARSDLDIFLTYADEMGFTNRSGRPLIGWRTPEAAFDAWAAVTAGRPVDYTGLSYDRLRGPSGIPWPVNEEHPDGTDRLYTDGVFPTDTDYCETFGHDLATGGAVTETEHRAMNPAGRAFLKGAAYTPPHEEPSEDHPLRYTTGRTVYQFHTRTKTGRSADLDRAAPDAWVELSAHDAAQRGIEEGDWVRVASPRGAIEVRARIGDVMDGAVFAPFHYGHWEPAESSGGGHADAGHRLANELTMTVWDPVSKQPTFKTAACQVTRLRAGDGPSPAPTTTASAPATAASAPPQRRPRPTAGGAPTTSTELSSTPDYALDPAQSRGAQ